MRKLVSLIAVLACVGLAAGVHAQTATGQITGTVTDSSGAVMPGVKVVVTSQQTGLTRETTTSDVGNYVVPLLPVGNYLVTAEREGFKLAVQSDIQLNVDQVQRIDLKLEAGNVSERVEVRANASTIDTETSTVGQLVSERQVTQLPLNGRNFLQLLFLGAGAVETDGEQAAMRQGVGNAISIMGSRPTSNNFMIDGTSNIDTSLGTPAAILSIDIIQEFKEQTATYSAEYGFSANQINIVSKSGTNAFHGSAFAFFRNESLDARNFFDPANAPKPKLDQKQPGFYVGGPVRLPFYDGRNKTFFLFNYEATRIERGASSFSTVPSPEELSGHFTTTIIDPTTGQPFPNNTIPQDRWSRLAKLTVPWWPAPNSNAAQGNFQLIRTLPQNQDQFTIRADQDLAKYGRTFFRLTRTMYDNRTNANLNDFGDRQFVQDTTNWQIQHTWALKSNLVNNFRFGRVDARADQKGIPCAQSDVDSLQLTGVFTDIPDDQRECPSAAIEGFTNYVGGAINAYSASNQPMWDISNTTTWIRGSHTLNFGFNYRRWWLQRDLATGFLGSPYNFNIGFTGNRVADYLLGYYTNVGLFQPAAFSVPGQAGNPREFNFKYLAPYVQDDWKVNSSLTLNLGVRFDYRNVPYETRNRMAWRNVDFGPGGLLVADETLVSGGITDGAYYQFAGRRSPENEDRFKVFAPRVGFAWRMFDDERTVLRGGYGVFFDSAEGREIDGAADVYPYVSRGNYQQSLGQSAPLQTTDTLFPSFEQPGVATPAANTFLAVSQSPLPKNPYVQQWSLGVQRQLTPATTLELNYIGNKGTNLLMRQNIAQAFPFDPANPLSVEERRPYPNFVVYIDSNWGGRSNYNAFNTKLEHRGRASLLPVAYTWAKSTDSKSAAAGIGASGFNGWQGFLNNHDPERDHGLSDFDVDHRMVGSFVYNLPFGNGEKFAGDATGVKNAVVGGWQVNGIYTWQHGFPITIQASDLGGLNDTFGSNRADLVGDPDVGDQTVERWFNTQAFAQPGFGQFGTSGRNILRGPGINNFDFSLFKNFELGHDMRLQFRLESFNFFNHPQFNGVDTNVANSTFGVVNSARAGRINQLGLKFLF